MHMTFNAIIQQVNNMITSVDNSDSLAKAPTLQLVKTLLSSLNIKNATDVVNALESEKSTGLGIRYDFSNVNAWYICLGKLFGNLIIQGTYDLHVQPNDIWTYPLSVTKCLTIQVTDQGTGRAIFSVDHIDNTKARVFGAGGRIPRIFMIGTI